ncbi:MAG: DUF6503 family protein [bacterium]
MQPFIHVSTLLFLNVILFFSCTRKETPAPGDASGFEASRSDPRALEIVAQMWQALDGRESWEKANFLSFRWVVERDGKDVADFRHDWDRAGHRYRVEGRNRQGQHFVVIFDIRTKHGEVYLDGKRVDVDSTTSKMVDMAYRRYINDSYWFVMPYKLTDPGVILNYDGEQEGDGKMYDVLNLTFDNVGLTPDDTYWLYVDRDDHLIKKWQYHLQGWETDAERSGSSWEDWQEVNGLKLAMNKVFSSGRGRIYFKDVRVAEAADDAIFLNSSRTF